jgi:hypothetical protein
MIAVGIYYSFFKHTKVHENKAKGQNPKEEQCEEELTECYRAFEKDTPSKPWNLILPLIVFIYLYREKLVE